MCGIVGFVGRRPAAPILLEGLKRLEYRGYDSAGIGVLSPNGKLNIIREVGKIANLEKKLKKYPVSGFVGISHVRWSTHGAPSEENAHPHTDCKGEIVLVHNGIIENYHELRERLRARGHNFKSETDTEVLAHLFEDEIKRFERPTSDPKKIFSLASRALRRVRGAYAIVVLARAWEGTLLGIRKDCPLVVGVGSGEAFLASDVPALLPFTRKVIFIEDGDMALLGASGEIHLARSDGRRIVREATVVPWDPVMAEKGGFKHFMLKEIHEGPRSFEDTLRARTYDENLDSLLAETNLTRGFIRDLKEIKIVACGTAFHAGRCGEYLFERFVKVPTHAEIASEFRYKNRPVGSKTLVIAVSQSGETADTLAALRGVKNRTDVRTLGIINAIGSTLTREAHGTLYTRCGPEIGVASTKAFLGQLAALYVLALAFGRIRSRVSAQEFESLSRELLEIPSHIRAVLDNLDTPIAQLAREFQYAKSFLYLGRHIMYPIALEAALKLKEISYIHAEGYAAGELKHGPIALVDRDMPIFAFAPRSSSVYEKTASNLEEVYARGAKIISVATQGDKELKRLSYKMLPVPALRHEWFEPVLGVVCAQLFAYYVASLKGLDVDQPRNLAKSVTVE